MKSSKSYFALDLGNKLLYNRLIRLLVQLQTMINKSKELSPIYSVKNPMMLQLELRRDSEVIPKYQKIRERQSFKFKELLKLIEKGGERAIEQSKNKQNMLEKIDLSLVQLEKTPKVTANLKIVNERNNTLNNKRHRQVNTQMPEECSFPYQSERNRVQWKQKMNQNQISIKFPQLSLVKEALVIQESLMCEKKSKEKDKLRSLSLRKKIGQEILLLEKLAKTQQKTKIFQQKCKIFFQYS